MLQKQKDNIFGFNNSGHEELGLEKTATFFHPGKLEEKEASFSTNNTDATRETSSQSTPPQPTKAEPRKKVCTVKRVTPVHINSINQAMNNKHLINLPLISSRIKSAVEKNQRGSSPSNLIRNCSQHSLRREIDTTEKIIKPRSSACQTPTSVKSIVIHKRLPSDQSEHRPYNLNQQAVTESGMDDEYGFDPNELLLGAKVLSKSNSKTRLKVTKVNRIKVITSLPNAHVRTRTEETVSLLNSTGEEKGLKIETKIRDMINSNIEDLKLSTRLYPLTTKSRNLSTLVLPEPLSTPMSRLLSPTITPILTEEELPMIIPTSTTFRRLNSNPNKAPLGLEPIRVVHDMHTPMKDYVDNALVSTRFYSESSKNVKTEGPLKDIKLNFALSPQHNAKFNVFTFKGSSPSKQDALEGSRKVQKRVNIKFKNEEAVLDKLFRPVIKKNE